MRIEFFIDPVLGGYRLTAKGAKLNAVFASEDDAVDAAQSFANDQGAGYRIFYP